MPNIRTVSIDTPGQEQQVFASEDEIARQRALAKALREGVAQNQQVTSPWQGAANMVGAAFAGIADRKARTEADARQQALSQALGGMFGQGAGSTPDPKAMATIFALDPELGAQLSQRQQEMARQAQQDAFARQEFEWKQRQAEREANAPIRANAGDVFLDPNTMQPRYSVPRGPTEVSPGASLAAPGEDGNYGTLYTAPAAPKAPGDRPHAKGPDGLERYMDTGEPVFPGVEAKPEPPKFSDIASARKEFENQPGVSRYRTAAPILSSMIKSVDDPSSMSDLDFIYGMAKIFDPESVVRESEMGLVLQGQSIPQQVVGLWSRAVNGENVLQGTTRQDLIRASGVRVGQYRQQAEGETRDFTSIAQRQGLNPADIIRPLEELPLYTPPTPVAPAPDDTSTLPRVTDDGAGQKAYEALPSGAQYVGPDGQVRTKR